MAIDGWFDRLHHERMKRDFAQALSPHAHPLCDGSRQNPDLPDRRSPARRQPSILQPSESRNSCHLRQSALY